MIFTLNRPFEPPHYVGVIDVFVTGNAPNETGVNMSIYGTAETLAEAEEHQNALIKRYGIINNHPPPEPRVTQLPTPVLCRTTGVRYASAAAACRAHDIDKSAMSTHLRKPEMFPTVKGLVFRRIIE